MGNSLNPQQFGTTPYHEMSRSEFEALPGTMFHGNPTGNFNIDQPRAHYGFHVGSRQAAADAVVARAGYGKYSTGERIPAPLKGRRENYRGIAHPESLRGGRVVSPMVNSPHILGAYGKGEHGDMSNSGDVMANARAAQIHSKGQTMRQGIYYKNASEDAGSVSAVLPERKHFKTHEDYLVEARAAGHALSPHALEGYTEIPGQQRLF